MSCGVYLIKSLATNKVYIGSSKNIESRWYAHLCDIKKGIHINPGIRYEIQKYGESNFIFEVIYKCQEDKLEYWEKHYLDVYVNLFNIKPASRKSCAVKRDLRVFSDSSIIHIKDFIENNSIKKLAKESYIGSTTIKKIINKQPVLRLTASVMEIWIKEKIKSMA